MKRDKDNGLTYRDFLEGTRAVLEESQKEKERYKIKIMGESFIVYPNVFSPKYFNDSELFAKHLPIKRGDELLEIGPGTGVVSIFALKKGAKRVVAVDINPDAVKNTKENAEIHGLERRLDVRLGSVYEPLGKEEKFDAIFWNTPFGFVENSNLTDIERSVFDDEYRTIETFVKQARQHLREGGRLYLGVSSTLGKMELLAKFAKESGFELKLLYEVDSTETHPVKFEIVEAVSVPDIN